MIHKLRYRRDHAPDKLWCIDFDPDSDGLIVKFGAEGHALRTVIIPKSNFSTVTAAQEANVRCDNKLAKGYDIDHAESEVVPQAVSRKVTYTFDQESPLGDWFF